MAPEASPARSTETRRVLRRVLYLNLAVVLAKALAYAASGALSVLAEVAHSSLDASNNVFALWVARLAGREPDDRHPYGHRKFETLGALLLVALLSVAVFELARGAIVRLGGETPTEVHVPPLTLVLMTLGLLAGLVIATFETRRGRALQSDMLLADAAHTRADVLTTLGVLAGLGLVKLGFPRADAWVALGLAAVIAWTGWGIVRSVAPVLVDERAAPEGAIRALAETHPRVVSCYGVRSRGRSGDVFAELTISLDPTMSVAQAHQVADQVETLVAGRLRARHVVVHMEPANLEGPADQDDQDDPQGLDA